MIRVTVEIVPFGIEEQKREIGKLEIANVGGTRSLGDYEVRRYMPDKKGKLKLQRKRWHLTKFARLRRNCWDLLLWSLCAIAGRDNGVQMPLEDELDPFIGLEEMIEAMLGKQPF